MEDNAPCGKTIPLPARKQLEERKIHNKEARFRIKETVWWRNSRGRSLWNRIIREAKSRKGL
jgi:hypothetical protein